MNPFIIPLAFFLISSSAETQPSTPLSIGNRPVGLISRDLNITPEQFTECFSDVNPAPRGEDPNKARVHSNKNVLLTCLRKYNPAITNDSPDTVMDRYRPEGREGGMPR